MTFYHVISAILFFGAFRELLAAIDSFNLVRVALACTVALLVFNDAFYTSWAIEQQERKYSPPLMSIDLANFFILSAVLISMNSTRESVFEVATPRIGSWLPDYRGWLLLALYWLLIILWTKIAGVYATPGYPKWLIYCSLAVALVFLVQGGFAAWSTGLFRVAAAVVAAAYVFVYILVLRPVGLKGLVFEVSDSVLRRRN